MPRRGRPSVSRRSDPQTRFRDQLVALPILKESPDPSWTSWIRACVATATQTLDIAWSESAPGALGITDLLATDYLPEAADMMRSRFLLRGGSQASRVPAFDALSGAGWQVRTGSAIFADAFVLVDGQLALIFFEDGTGKAVLESPMASALAAHFEQLWGSSTQLLYEDFVSPHAPDIAAGLRTTHQQWNRVLDVVARQPDRLWNMDPREFETFIAELLRRSGFEGIELTSKTRDGGRDILVATSGVLGEHLHLVECKRYQPERPVKVGLVRSLYGVMEAERATGALLVTTSYFSRGAVAFRNEVRHRLSLADYNDIVGWLRRLRT